MLALNNPEDVNARNGTTGDNVDGVNRAVGLGAIGVDLGSEAEFAEECGGLVLILLPPLHWRH